MFICPEGEEFEKKVGRKSDVWEMRAYQTSSGLQKADLKLNRRGKVVSKLRSERMSERFKQYGGLTKKEEKKEKQEKKDVKTFDDLMTKRREAIVRRARQKNRNKK